MAEEKTKRRSLLVFIGLAVAASAFALGIVLLVAESFIEGATKYSSLVTYLVIPAFIAMGLVLAVLGTILKWLRGRRAEDVDKPLPVFDFNTKRAQRITLVVVVAVTVFFGVSAVATYRGFQYTESTEFCGTLCHRVMGPEYTAYQHSPHARVPCVECHIGSGADWYVRSKISGLRQVWRTAMDSYEMPIEVPIQHLRPARETCEHCHWTDAFTGSVERIQWHFWYDRDNTPSVYRMLMHVGGTVPETGSSEGIHWHISDDETVRYWPRDRQRLDIPWVEVERPDGTTTVFRSPDAPEERPPEAEFRVMDCIDCHNRPSHIYRPPDEMVNRALARGTLDRSIPNIKTTAVGLLTAHYDSQAEASEAITSAIRERYLTNGDGTISEETANHTVEVLVDIFNRTQFPENGVSWRTYPDHIGHRRFPGCFRCHNDQHATEDGEVISMECNQCHDFVFQAHGQDAYGPVTYATGPWEHPEGMPDIYEGMMCTDCHAVQVEAE